MLPKETLTNGLHNTAKTLEKHLHSTFKIFRLMLFRSIVFEKIKITKYSLIAIKQRQFIK